MEKRKLSIVFMVASLRNTVYSNINLKCNIPFCGNYRWLNKTRHLNTMSCLVDIHSSHTKFKRCIHSTYDRYNRYVRSQSTSRPLGFIDYYCSDYCAIDAPVYWEHFLGMMQPPNWYLQLLQPLPTGAIMPIAPARAEIMALFVMLRTKVLPEQYSVIHSSPQDLPQISVPLWPLS